MGSDLGWLPEGVSVDPKRTLVGWWAGKRPEAGDFRLTDRELDRDSNATATRRLNWFGWTTIAAVSLVVAGSLGLKEAGFIDQRLLVLLLAAEAAIAIGVYWTSAAPYATRVEAYAGATNRREAFRRSKVQFDTEVRPWREQQCDPHYWAARNDEGELDRAVADLLLGLFPEGGAGLVEGDEDAREADVVAGSATAKTIVRCRRGDATDLEDVRRLAAAKLFFRADIAILVTGSPEGESDQIRDYATRCGLTFWNAERLAHVASLLPEDRTHALDCLRIAPIAISDLGRGDTDA